jgi:hypothetical protein
MRWRYHRSLAILVELREPSGLAAQGANREHYANHRHDRTDDGPGRRIAHRAAADDAEALQSPQQAEQENDDPENSNGNAHSFTLGADLAMMEA